MRRFLQLGGWFVFTGALAHAQLTILFQQRFDVIATPWASTGSVSLGQHANTPVLQNTVLAPIAGNVYSAQFNGETFEYLPTSFSTSGLGYGVELWVKNAAPSSYGPSTTLLGFGLPANTGTTGNGISLSVNNKGKYSGTVFFDDSGNHALGTFGDVAAAGSGSIDGWDHLAIVTDQGTTTLYVNGSAQASYATNAPNDPSADWHLFVNPGVTGSYVGYADDVKFFTFSPGTFTAAQLDYVSAIPEPSTYAALIGLAALGFVALRRRRARRS